MVMEPYHVIGLDLGQTNDPTALVLLEWNSRTKPTYRLRALRSFPLGTPYTKLPAALKPRLNSAPLAGRVALAIDATGVGAAVVDDFYEQLDDVSIYAITITGGTAVTRRGKRPNVPKSDLISTACVVLEQRRLRVAANMRETETLIDQLLAYRRTTNERGHDTYAAASGSHDDLVIALALALWTAENKNLVPRPARTNSQLLKTKQLPTTDEMLARAHARNWNFPYNI
jgi:hypothetical protein